MKSLECVTENCPVSRIKMQRKSPNVCDNYENMAFMEENYCSKEVQRSTICLKPKQFDEVLG